MQDLGVRAPGRPLRRRRERGRVRVLTRIEFDPGPAEHRTELAQALLVRRRMHPVQERNPAAGEPAGGGHVRREHALFDELVGDAPGRGLDVRDVAARREENAGLPDLEVYGAPPPPLLPQHAVDLPECFEMGHEPPEPPSDPGVAVKHRRLHLPVGEARPRAHDRVAEEGPRDPPTPVDVKLAGEAQPVHLRVERADPVREPLRQHRHHPPGEVDGGAAGGRFAVEGRFGRHVVGYVGDGDGELPAPRPRVAVDRVVEVLRVRPVDGHQGEVAEVRPIAGHIRDLEGKPLRFGQRIVRPDMGDPVGPDRDLRRHAGPFGVAQALNDTPGRSVAPPLSDRWIGKLDHHHLPIRPLPVRNRHVVGKVPVIGGHEGDAPRAEEAAYHDPVVALDQLDHHASSPGARPGTQPGTRPAPRPGDPDLAGNPVPVHEALHLARGQEHVLAPVVAGEEPVPVAVGDHPPLDHFRGVHGAPPGSTPRFRPCAAGGPAHGKAAGAPRRRGIVIGGSIASCHSRGAAVHCRPFRGPRWRNW